MARGRLCKEMPDLLGAQGGSMRDHHRYLLRMGLQRLEEAERDIKALESRIDTCLQPYQPAIELLETTPGVGHGIAAVIVAEAGADMSILGGVGPGQQREWWQVQARTSTARQSAFVRGPGRGSVGSLPHTQHIPAPDVLAMGGAHREEEGLDRTGA